MSGSLQVLGDVSRETSERLSAYAALLRKWNPAINLVARSTLDDLETRHFKDSAQLFGLCPTDARHWVDLGSGGGFPGLVIAILARELAPDLHVTLIESDQRKAAFLRTVCRDLGVAATNVIDSRIESAKPQGADVLSARALAPLPRLLDYADRHLAPGGVALFPKGARFAEELDAALASWRFDVQNHPSKTDPQAVVLKLGGIARV
ncbi:16S rRNA (guanine(527)-N(7))-methyltransferase RsmG [Rhodovulum sulfidophilum]|uniref:Ribosomal RNA small subunit methyltransferase G n=1 Tax=Rhodovulum visakhapatnamense TaxID=364297 RepID=A0ABS1RAB8_9RHOB|nr:16S rRNA (guanine(527)-N(7))-methyltransferase RsmG [Rhodovulum visakhapatnamense]MBL3568266.1 16S rRNA (guanine(527)-N(7))-methyltransferase RsmG [Rhodovulum visakhapatnamense]MBL3576596.1 16S rRNA (guanine(527)-N(7))-methyltransferase RsmG [Rhodovulum visakhapatnamense]OLS43215.1 16S rRNA (guanine(527)-N(7))-methyltransferase RsmG [Rhodovulum sulfidophilum]